jgi:transposase
MNSRAKNVIKHKPGNVSRACKVMGVSRDTFYRYQSARAEGGLEALLDTHRKKPNLRNRVAPAIEAAVAAFALEQPAFGQVRMSNELRQRGIFVSPSGVRSIWLRCGLASFKHPLAALAGKDMLWPHPDANTH